MNAASSLSYVNLGPREEVPDLWKPYYDPSINSKSASWDDLETRLLDSKPAKESLASSRAWVWTALGAAFSFAIANCMLTSTSHLGVYTLAQTGYGNLIYSILYMLSRSKNSTRDTNMDMRFCMLLLCDMAITFGGSFMVIATFQAAQDNQMNTGVITALFSFTCLYLSLASYFLFNEKLSIRHLIGMTCMLLCVIALLQKQEAHTSISVIPVLCALATSFFFCLRTVLLKILTINYSYDPVRFTSTSYGGLGLIMSIVATIMAFGHKFNLKFLILNISSGIFNGLGNTLINHATSTGLSGPASSLTNMQPMIQTMLNMALFFEIPSHLQVLGLALSVTGSVLLTIQTQQRA